MKSFHEGQKFDDDDKSKVDFDTELKIEEYFEIDVKPDVESDTELGA